MVDQGARASSKRYRGPRNCGHATEGIGKQRRVARRVRTGQRERRGDVQRTRRIVEALRVLQKDLPPFIESLADGLPLVDLASTLALQDLVRQHQPLVDAVKPRGKGQIPSPEGDLKAYLSNRLYEIWNGEAQKTAADAFAVEAMTWLLEDRPAPPSDGAISKVRRRRT